MDNTSLMAKLTIADSFSRAAESYDQAAWYQRRVGESALRLVPERMSGTCIDVGAGTGFFTRKLVEYPLFDLVLGIDLAEGMMRFSHQKDTEKMLSLPSWVVGDGESLPLHDHTVDLIYSNMAIQWLAQPELLFSEWRRVLKKQGRIIFSTLLPATLHELASCWEQVDQYQHVNTFTSLAVLEQAVKFSGLNKIYWQRSIDVLQYASLKTLLRELKEVGAHNLNQTRPKGMMGKKKWQQFQEAYELLRSPEGGLPATWHVLYGVLSYE